MRSVRSVIIHLGVRVTQRLQARFLGPITGLLLLLAANPALSQVMEPDSSPPLFRTQDLTYAALFFGSLLAIDSFEGIDATFSPGSEPTGFARGFHDAGDFLGRGSVAIGLSGGAWLGGALSGNSRLSRIGRLSLGAMAASTIMVLPSKVIIGRQRPSGIAAETSEFDSFTFSRQNYSFPSGHTSSLFALAGVVSDEFADDAPWVAYVAYPIAFLTGASRVVGREHWVTDVLAGAVVGVFASNLSRRLLGGHGDEAGSGTTVQPLLSAGVDGWILGMSAQVR